MALNFGNPSMGSPKMSHAEGAQNGPDLEEIQTEVTLAGEAKVQLLPTPWPADQLPPPTSSLLSIASRLGVAAAAGPDAVILARTETMRKAFNQPTSIKGHLKAFEPEMKLSTPVRISQLAFSADETHLVWAAELGSGLTVHEVVALMRGSTQSAFEIPFEKPSNSWSLRALIPNPVSEKGELFAVITADGNLMMANLKERKFVPGAYGQVLKAGVSCVTWSTWGKQLVAGLGNGAGYQMTPDGKGKGDIPRPPNLDGEYHVSSITWLENNVFLMVHTPSSFTNDTAPTSVFHVVTKQPNSNSFVFQNIADPAPPFGLNRSPPHHFMLRLREFPPSLQDMIVVASSASSDIGLFTRSKVPLSGDKPVDKTSGVFTMTEMSDDSRRAQLPINESSLDTSPIGVAFDLSSREKATRPIPGDEMDESPTPLPALMVLNNDGILAAWWIVYVDSIRQGTIYPGLAVAPPILASTSAPLPVQNQPSVFSSNTKPTFGSSTFGSTSSLQPTGVSSSFGAPSGLGQQNSPWGSTSTSTSTAVLSAGPTFGASTFGSSPVAQVPTQATVATPHAPAGTLSFGSSGLPGSRQSPWGSSTGNTSGLGQTIGSHRAAFGALSPSGGGSNVPSSGGFASFASGGGFANVASTSNKGGSIFGAKATPSPLGIPASSSSMNTESAFRNLNETNNKSVKPAGFDGFVLGSTFKADSSNKDSDHQPHEEPKSSFFGSGFQTALGGVAKPTAVTATVSEEIDMDSANLDHTEKPQELLKPTLRTPAPVQLDSFSKPSPTGGSLFENSLATSASSNNSARTAGFFFGQDAFQKVDSTGNGFGVSTSSPSAISLNTPTLKSAQASEPSESTAYPKMKEEDVTESTGIDRKIPEAPLPPESTTKDSYAVGDTSNSSLETDAPLPSKNVSKSVFESPQQHSTPLVPEKVAEKPIPADLIPPSDVPGGPEDDGDESGFFTEEEEEGQEEDDEGEDSEDQFEEPSDDGSIDDAANLPSAADEPSHTPSITPQSSFGGVTGRTPDGILFSQMQKSAVGNRPGSLFGEVGKTAPILPPPKTQPSPRSPSPIRSVLPGRVLRSESSRSVSAPGVASQLVGSQTRSLQPAELSQLPSKKSLALAVEESRANQRRRAELNAQKEAEEKRALIDGEDEMMQRHLASDVVGTRTLDEFVAHSDYVRNASAESIPHQVEVVYRDINSMIDTLGFNARSLKSFVKGHTEQYKEQGRSRGDLEEDEGWCLVEIEDLSSLIEKELTEQLKTGVVSNFASKVEICNDLQKDIIRLRAKHEDVKKIFESHRDSSQQAIARSQSLSAEQAAQQHDLRRDFMKFQKLLSKAEEGLTTLKAGIVAQAASSGRPAGATGPSVEAVMRTIAKMTGMAEKRSGDVDVLEAQMRKLRFEPAASVGSREESPFATPQNHSASMRASATSGTYGLFYTPDSINDARRDFRSSLISTASSQAPGSPPRKKISGYSSGEKLQLKARIERRKEVTGRLRAALQHTGTNVRLLEDE